jgi:hypothetical protein
MTRRAWLVYGPPEDKDLLVLGDEEDVQWTIHRDAVVGDDVLFYLKSPVSAIVASGRLLTPPSKEKWAEKWSTVMPYGATIKVTTVYEPPIEFRELSCDDELFNFWGLVRAQMQSATGPQLVLPSILDRLKERHGLDLEP